MITWRTDHPREICIFHTKLDDILTGRRPSTKKGEQFSLLVSQYADDTRVLFISKESVETNLPIRHFSKFALQVNDGTQRKKILNLKFCLLQRLIVFMLILRHSRFKSFKCQHG